MLPNIAAGPVVYPTVLARFGRFIPNLMPTVMKMRQAENKKTAVQRPPLPHVPHALLNVPSEDVNAQRILQNNMRKALDDMHRQIIDDIAKFIDNKLKDIGWLTSPVNIDYIASDLSRKIVTAYDKNQLQSLIKLLTFFALVIDTKEIPPTIVGKVVKWYQDAEAMFADINFPKRAYRTLDPAKYGLTKPGKVNNYQTIIDGLKQARVALRSDPVKKGLAQSSELNKRYQLLLNNLFTFFNSDSDNAYNAIVNNIHSLGDADLNALMTPEFKGDPRAEAAKLNKMIIKHGGTGHTLTKEQGINLKETNEEAHKAVRKQITLVTNAVRTEVRKLVRQSGKDKLRANVIKQGLEKAGLPTHAIPKGFDPGFYDQDMNMYSPKGELLSVNMVNGWVTWDKDGDGKGIGEYQTPAMQKKQSIYTRQHAKVDRKDEIFGHVATNIENLDNLKDRWVKDSKSTDPRTQMLAYMTQTMYYLSLRVGGGMTDNENTYGLSTMQVGHVYRKALGKNKEGVELTELIFQFKAKSGVQQKLKLSPEDGIRIRLINYILKRMQGKRRADPLWTLGNRTNAISPGLVNNYLKTTGWSGSAKVFRPMRATVMIDNLLSKEPSRFSSNANAVKWLEDQLKTVGETLGHKRSDKDGNWIPTWQTAATSYVNPKTIIDFFQRHHINPMPSWSEALKAKI